MKDGTKKDCFEINARPNFLGCIFSFERDIRNGIL